ncbi:MAG: aldehyde dehydrogenase family protein [candidate division Zixibacteria bacterium]
MARNYDIYLAGKFLGRKEKQAIRNPYDDSLVGKVSLASSSDMTKAISIADKTFAQTKNLPSYVRSGVCISIADQLSKEAEKFAVMMSAEVGKAIRDCRGEVSRAIEVFRLAAEESKRIGGEIMDLDTQPGADGRFGLIRRFPVGVIAGICPFNFPLNLVAHKVAPAIASGNCIIIKPAPKTPIIALMLARILDNTDYPKGAISVLPATNEDSAPLIHDDRVKVISFTGSDKVGWWIKNQAGRKKVVLELGGNAGVAVADDADLDYAIDRILYGGFASAGQSCISVQRIFVHEKIYTKFMRRFIPLVKKLKVGNPLNEKTNIGTLVDDSAVAKTRALIAESVKAGARVLVGGKIRGRLMQPTVMTDVKSSMPVCVMEAFAPLVTVSKYKKFDKVISEINNSDFGLQAGIFTNRMDDVFRAYRDLDVGGVVINDIPTFRADQQPYGGVKNSGVGREGVRYAIEDMTELKILSLNLR